MSNSSRNNHLHVEIAAQLRAEVLRKYRKGDRFPGDDQLCKRFGVSGVTIRQAVFQLVQEGLLIRKQGSGTYVAEAHEVLRIGIYTEQDIYFPRVSSFIPHVIAHLRKLLEADERPHRVYVGQQRPAQDGSSGSAGDSRPVTCPAFVDELAGLSGVILLSTHPDPSWFGPLTQRRVPVVGSSFLLAKRTVHDYAGALARAVRELHAAGRRRIALMDWNPQPDDGDTLERARPYFLREMERLRLPLREAWLRGETHPLLAGAGWRQFQALWDAGPEKPDALIVTDDMLFPDTAAAILQKGLRVPDDLMVVTHANKGSGMHFPFPVHRMEFDPAGYARGLCELLREAEAGDAKPRTLTVPYAWRPGSE